MKARREGPVAIVIPAAGASRRLGFPKQLAVIEGESLLLRAVMRALATQIGPVIAVLGHQAERLAAEVDGLACDVVAIDDWAGGMSASIRAGVTRAAGDERVAAVLITLVDQWSLTAGDLTRLTEAWRSGTAPIAAAEYEDTIGVPAVFDRTHFHALQSLTGDAGARHLLRKGTADVIRVAMPNAAADFDERPQ